MIHEYAVDPDSLSSFNQIWQALEQFGVAHGRVLVQCPKKWWRIVKRNLEQAEAQLQPGEYKALEERCFRLKEDRKMIFRKNLKFDGEKPFAEALATEHQTRPFRALVQLNPESARYVPLLSRFDLHDMNPLWRVARCLTVAKSADVLAENVVPLLKISADFLMVDPYFAARPQEWQSFPVMLKRCLASDHGLQRIELHTKTAGTRSFDEKTIRDFIRRNVPSGLTVSVLQWVEREGGDRLHDRFVLTDRGGIQSSFGWDNGEPGQTTTLSLLDVESYRFRWDQYQKLTAAFDLVSEFVIQT